MTSTWLLASHKHALLVSPIPKMMPGRGLPTKGRLKRRELWLTGMVLLLLSMLLRSPITPKVGRPLAVPNSDKT